MKNMMMKFDCVFVNVIYCVKISLDINARLFAYRIFFKVGSKMKKAIYFEIGEEAKYW